MRWRETIELHFYLITENSDDVSPLRPSRHFEHNYPMEFGGFLISCKDSRASRGHDMRPSIALHRGEMNESRERN